LLPLSPPILGIGQRDPLTCPQASQLEFRGKVGRYLATTQAFTVPDLRARELVSWQLSR